MEQKSEQSLESLPPSNDEYWKEADVHTNLVPETVNKGEHYFEYVSAVVAQCKHCDWGFQLDKGDKLIDGHLFDREGKLVI